MVRSRKGGRKELALYSQEPSLAASASEKAAEALFDRWFVIAVLLANKLGRMFGAEN